MSEKLQIFIGQVLLIGLLFSLILTILGGSIYLVSQGGETYNYQTFEKPGNFAQTHDPVSHKIWRALTTFSAYNLILIGIIILVLTQLLRVLLVAWYYFKLKDLKFCWLSLFIFAILLFSLF